MADVGGAVNRSSGFADTGTYAGAMADATEIDTRLRDEYAHLTATLCKAVNDPKRLMLLHLLGDCPRPVGELAAAIDAPQANVSQHLAVLREQGLVETERQGASIIYSLRHPRVLEAIRIMREVQADEAARRASLYA